MFLNTIHLDMNNCEDNNFNNMQLFYRYFSKNKNTFK